MKRLTGLLYFICCVCSCWGQSNAGTDRTNNRVRCSNIEFNVNRIIPQVMPTARWDSVNAILDFYEKECPNAATLTQLKILVDIERGRFDETNYDPATVFDELIAYERRVKKAEKHNYQPKDEYEETRKGLDDFTKDRALNRLNFYTHSDVERFLLLIYAHRFDEGFDKLKNKELQSSRLQTQRDQDFEVYKKDFFLSVKYGLGRWFARDNLSKLGNRTLYGLGVDLRKNKFSIGFYVNGYYGFAPEMYVVNHNYGVLNTNRVTGSALGIEGAFHILKYKKNSLYISGGIGFLTVSPRGNGTKEWDDPGYIDLLSTRFAGYGLGYRRKLNTVSYIELDARFNFTDLENEGGTDLSGNVIFFTARYGMELRRNSNIAERTYGF